MVLKKFILLFVLLFSINTVFALDFTGYAKDTAGNGLDNVSVSIEVYNYSGMGMGLSDTITEFSNASGFFNLSINGTNLNEMLNYKPVLVQYNASTGYAIYMGQSLPSFPYGDIEDLSASTTTFYLKRAITIDLSAT